MKIKRGNLLTVLLAILCAALIALGVGFALPKREIKTARAASGLPFTKSDLDALAAAAGYSNYGTMYDDVINNGTALNAGSFGNHTVEFGGMIWWPVLVSATGDDIILTLWAKDSAGSHTWSDGTNSSSTSTNPASNDYTYSWIRAAINAGKTDIGYYYGKWGNSSSDQQPTQYQNSQKSPSAQMAPTSFTAYEDFVTGGAYASYLVPVAGDNVWLPALE